MVDKKGRTPTRSEGSRLFFYGGGRSDGATPKEPVDPASQFSRPEDYAGNSPQSFENLYGGHPTTPPNANPAAMRGYTRNAPYMEELVGDPQKMMGEIYSLQMQLNQNPDDVVSEYRLRILKQAIHDIYNMQPASRDTGGLTSRAIGQTTPGPTDYYNYNPVTPVGRR